MTVVGSNLTVGSSSTSGTTFTSATITPNAKNLYLLGVVVENGASTNPGNPTVSGCGLTWALVTSQIYDSTSGSRRKLFVFRTLGASPANGSVVINTAETDVGCLWSLDGFSGVDLSGANGVGAVVQTASNSDETGLVSTLTATLGAFKNVANATYGADGNATGNLTVTQGAGFTKLGATGLISPGIDLATEWKNSTDTTVDFSLSANDFIGVIGLEIRASVPNLVQSAGTSDLASTATSASWGANTTSGNTVIVGATVTNAATVGTVSSVTDTQGNTYARAIRGTQSEGISVIDTEIWYGTNIVGGAGSVTVNHTADNCAVYAREYTTYNVLDATLGTAVGSSAAPNSGTSATTAVAAELVIAAFGDDKGVTQTYADAGSYADVVGTTNTLVGLSMLDNLVTATGAQTGTETFGATANWIGLTATFYGTTGAVARISTLGLMSAG